MPRRAREKSESGIYHIILRGVNRQEVFHDDEDCLRFLSTLARYKKQATLAVYGWCLMGNHVHLLLGEGREEIAATMKRIGVSYAWHYHSKYGTVGHLFQDRFRSERVNSDPYLMAVIRYIHQNPVKVGLAASPADWKWSSCLEYYGREVLLRGLLDSAPILEMFSGDRTDAIARFRQFNESSNDDACLDSDTSNRLTDDRARAEILKRMTLTDMAQIRTFPKALRDELLSRLKGIEGLTRRQASRILGVSAKLIFKA